MMAGRDPFADFGPMDPFGQRPAGLGPLMERFDHRSGAGRMMGMRHGMMGGMGGLGNGQYSVQTFAMTSPMVPDGRMHTEKYANSEVGNSQQSTREAQQAYSNSLTGLRKAGHERQLGERGWKV